MENNLKEKLKELLEKIPSYFEENELAYYSSQCKNELQIRDRIAWRLHKHITQKYGNQYVVRREWAPKEKAKSRVDLAILEMDDNKEKVEKVIALIEFKAQSIARREKWYQHEFTRDVAKMRTIKRECKECKNADLYFVFLETGQGIEAKEAKEYKSVLGFSKYEQGCVFCNDPQDKNYLEAVKSYWKDFDGLLGESIRIPDPEAIEIREAFGNKQYVSTLLIGPLK